MQALLKKSIDQLREGNILIERIRGVENLILARINYGREFGFAQGTVRIPIHRIEGQTECYHPYEFHLKFTDVQECRELVDLRALATFAGPIGCNCADLELAYALGAIGIPFDLEDIQIWRALLVAGRLEEALFFEKATANLYLKKHPYEYKDEVLEAETQKDLRTLCGHFIHAETQTDSSGTKKDIGKGQSSTQVQTEEVQQELQTENEEPLPTRPRRTASEQRRAVKDPRKLRRRETNLQDLLVQLAIEDPATRERVGREQFKRTRFRAEEETIRPLRLEETTSLQQIVNQGTEGGTHSLPSTSQN